MPRQAQDITDGELAVLLELWRKPAMSIRQLTDRLFPRGGAAHYGTVQKQLERLEDKKFVSRDRSLFVHLFSAAIDRDAFIGRRVDSVVQTLCEGSLTPIISHLLRKESLTPQQRGQLRALIDGDDKPGSKRPRQK